MSIAVLNLVALVAIDFLVIDTGQKTDLCIFAESQGLAQARNDNVRLPGSPYTAMDTVRPAGIRYL